MPVIQNLYKKQIKLKHTNLKSTYYFLINKTKTSLIILLIPLYKYKSHRLNKNLKIT